MKKFTLVFSMLLISSIAFAGDKTKKPKDDTRGNVIQNCSGCSITNTTTKDGKTTTTRCDEHGCKTTTR